MNDYIDDALKIEFTINRILFEFILIIDFI